MIEAIEACQEITGNKISWSYSKNHRVGDHMWWISDISKFKDHYPEWDFSYGLEDILEQLYGGIGRRL